MSHLIHNDELKSLISKELDVAEFLDTIEMSFEELIEIVFPELNEEQRSRLEQTFTS